MNLKESLHRYSAYKEAVTGKGELTENEVTAVRKAWKEGKFEEAKNNMPSFKEMVEAFRNFKLKETGSKEITLDEYTALKENFDKGVGAPATKPMKEGKEAPKAEENKTADTDIMKHVREARTLSYKARKALREGDMAGAQAATQDAMGAVDAAGAAVDATQGQVPQNIVDSVSAVKASVDDLATQCGIQPATDLNADPNAAVPATNDPNAADPNATAGAPMMENTSIDSIKARLAERQAALKAIKEGRGAAVDTTMANPLADIGGQNTNASERFVDHKNNESTLPEPSVASLVNGTEKGAIKWPTTKLSVKENTSLADEVVEKKLKESTENMDFASILASGVLG